MVITLAENAHPKKHFHGVTQSDHLHSESHVKNALTAGLSLPGDMSLTSAIFFIVQPTAATYQASHF